MKLLHLGAKCLSNCCFGTGPLSVSLPASPLSREPTALWFSWKEILLVFKARHFAGSGVDPKGWGDWGGPQSAPGSSSIFVRPHLIVSRGTVGWRARFLVRLYLYLSCLSQCGSFILCHARAVQLVSRSSSERIVPYVPVDLLCLWEEVRIFPTQSDPPPKDDV